MRVIGMLLGIPEEDQVAIRDRIDEAMRLEEGDAPDTTGAGINALDGSDVRGVHRLASPPPVR